MIEVLNRHKKRIGFIEENKFFNEKKKLLGSIEKGIVKNEKGRVLIRIDKHDGIFFENEQVGFILESTIYYREKPIYEFSKEKGEIHTSDGNKSLILKGEIENLEDGDFFGIASVYLESQWWERVTGKK
ncbi:MAG: hypothetical protein ACFFB0_06430 [Promethearchaeota archaeon]